MSVDFNKYPKLCANYMDFKGPKGRLNHRIFLKGNRSRSSTLSKNLKKEMSVCAKVESLCSSRNISNDNLYFIYKNDGYYCFNAYKKFNENEIGNINKVINAYKRNVCLVGEFGDEESKEIIDNQESVDELKILELQRDFISKKILFFKGKLEIQNAKNLPANSDIKDIESFLVELDIVSKFLDEKYLEFKCNEIKLFLSNVINNAVNLTQENFERNNFVIVLKSIEHPRCELNAANSKSTDKDLISYNRIRQEFCEMFKKFVGVFGEKKSFGIIDRLVDEYRSREILAVRKSLDTMIRDFDSIISEKEGELATSPNGLLKEEREKIAVDISGIRRKREQVSLFLGNLK
ncbi:MAG: hypothetical protein V4487_07580 [Chlamydiota bacterium]